MTEAIHTSRSQLLSDSSDDQIALLSLDSRQRVREVYASLFTPPIHTCYSRYTHPGVGGGTHRRRAIFDRC